MQILEVIHQTDTGNSMEELGEGLKELERFQHHRKNNINYPDTLNVSQKLLGTKQLPEEYTRVSHGSSCICSRGWTYMVSMGGDTLGLVKALCSSIGE